MEKRNSQQSVGNSEALNADNQGFHLGESADKEDLAYTNPEDCPELEEWLSTKCASSLQSLQHSSPALSQELGMPNQSLDRETRSSQSSGRPVYKRKRDQTKPISRTASTDTTHSNAHSSEIDLAILAKWVESESTLRNAERDKVLVSKKSFIHQPSFQYSGVAVSVDPRNQYFFRKDDLELPAWYMRIVHRVRNAAKKLIQKPQFDMTILVLIVVSCILQAIDDPTTDDETVGYQVVNDTLIYLFAIEMLIKLTALGFKQYFSLAWNWIDFLVVCEGLQSLVGSQMGVTLTSLRALRALRPLRSVKFLPGVAVVIGGMMKSVKSLGYVVLVYALFLLMFSLFAVQLWKGSFHNQCLHGHKSTSSSICGAIESEGSTDEDMLCTLLSVEGYSCSGKEVCTDTGANPNDFMSFDHVGYAMLTLFTVSTLDNWNQVMTWTQHVVGQYSILFFIFVILSGSYTLVNLVIATILDDIGDSMDEAQQKENEEFEGIPDFWIAPKRSHVAHKDHTARRAHRRRKRTNKADKEHGEESSKPSNHHHHHHHHHKDRAQPSNHHKGRTHQEGNREGKSTVEDKHHGDNNEHKDASALVSSTAEIPADEIMAVKQKQHKGIFSRFQSDKMIHMCQDTDSLLNKAMIGVLLTNAVIIACDSHGASSNTRLAIRIADMGFNGIFAAEALLKIFALGYKTYFTSFSCVFDFLTTVAAFADNLLRGYDSGFVVILRVLKLFRLFNTNRMEKFSPKLYSACLLVQSSAQNMLPAIILLFLCIFIFALFGMELFGNHSHGERYRFDSFRWAFIQVFLLIVGDGWSEMMFDVIDYNDSAGVYSLYFILLVIVGQYVILNLVLALVLDGNDEAQLAIDLKRKLAKILKRQALRKAFKKWHSRTKDPVALSESKSKDLQFSSGASATARESVFDYIPDHMNPFHLYSQEKESLNTKLRSLKLKVTHDGWEPSRLGKKCKAIIETKAYFWFLFMVILASTVLLFCEPVGNITETSLFCAEAVLCSIFITELVMKGLAYSFFHTPDALFMSPWNLLDVLLVIISMLHIILFFTGTATVNSEKILAVFQSFRPLRLGIRSNDFKELVLSLWASTKGVTSIILLLVILWGIYAIIGVQFFKGLLYSCSDPDFPEGAYRYGEVDANGTWITPPCSGVWVNSTTGLEEERNYEWERDFFHFDNIFAGMWSLWLLMTMENWQNLLWATMDTTEEDYQPKTNNNMAAFIYFFFGICIFGFYFINLSVGVIADTYIEISTNIDNRMDDAEEKVLDRRSRRVLMSVKPDVIPKLPEGRVQRFFFRIATHPRFESLVMFVLALVSIVLATNYEGQPDDLTEFQDICEEIFAFLFVVEALVMIIGLSPRTYFTDRSCLFDFFVTMVSMLDIIVFTYTADCSEDDSSLLNIIRGLRVLRLFRLCVRIEGTRKVLEIALYPINILGIVFYIISISIIVFGQIGVAIFTEYELSDYVVNYQNFDSLKSAIQLLYIVSTGEMWVDYIELLTDAGASLFETNAFFVIFLVFMQFLLVNLFVVIVCHTYDMLKGQGLLRKEIVDFKCLYSELVPQADKGLQRHEVFQVLSTLDKPLGLGKYSPFVGIQWRTDYIMKNQFETDFGKLLLACYDLGTSDTAILVDDATCQTTLQKAFSVSVIYRFLGSCAGKLRTTVPTRELGYTSESKVESHCTRESD